MLRTNRSITLLAIVFAMLCSLPAMAQWQLTGNRDANTQSMVGTTNGVPLRLGTKNLPRLFIDTTGRVGINTVNPTHLLHVAGKVKIADGTQGTGKVLTSDSAGVATWTTPVTSPWAVSGNNLYSINTGNIGIGTITPVFKLDVNGDARFNGIKAGKGKNSLTDNTAYGTAALDSVTTGTGNTAIGYLSLNQNTAATKGTAIGANALSKNTTGNENTATGNGALQKNTTGRSNTATGANAMINNTTGINNVANGDSALFNNIIGSANAAVGTFALKNTNANYNTGLGYQALQANTIGTSNTAVGYFADVSANNLTNATAIGANTKVATSNSLVLGNNANVGIGTSSPGAKLDVIGTVKITDGTQAQGKVLTSNATGVASWQIAPGSLWTLNNNNAYFSQAGNIGIGTSTPVARLEVNNTIKLSNTSTDPNDGIIGTGTFAPGLNIIGINTDSMERKINFWGSLIQNQNNTGNVFMGSTKLPGGVWSDVGFVGIGTQTPQQRLDIKGNLQFSNATLPKGFIDEVGGTTPLFTMSSNFHDANINTAYRGGAYRIDLRNGFPMHNWFARSANSNTENVIMTLNENAGLAIGSTFSNSTAPTNGAIIQGNVGIGTTSGANPLTVRSIVTTSNAIVTSLANAIGDGNFDLITARGVTTNASGDVAVQMGLNYLGYFNSMVRFHRGGSGTDGFMSFTTNGNTERMRIDPYGQVGINTSSPANTLDVNGGSTLRGFIQGLGGANIGGGYVALCNSLDNTQGNVSIGPTAYNNVKLTINTNQAYAISVDNGACIKPGGGSWGNSSDKRLKKEIKPYADGLNAIMKIKPVTYHYNEVSGFDMSKEYVGVLAQELNEVAPYMVTLSPFKNTGKDYYVVDNSAMTYMLVNAVKELKGQTDAKDETITKQQQQIDKLQQQMDLLMQKFESLNARQIACCNLTNGVPATTGSVQSTSLSSASLDQNIPNPPINSKTSIGYNIPKNAGKSELVINDQYGRKVKSVTLAVSGKGTLQVDTKDLAPGTYAYTLLVDGKIIDTKQMVVAAH